MPWRRLVKEWLIYAAIMAAIFAIWFRGDGLVPILAGLLVSGPLYLLFGFVMAKFGYTRKTLADLKTPRAGTATASTSAAPDTRPKPAPTRRTSSGSNRPNRSRRR